MVCAELFVFVGADLRCGDVRGILADIIGAAEADKTRSFQVIRSVSIKSKYFQYYSYIVSIAAHHLNKLIFSYVERLIIYTPRIHLTEPELTPLRDKSQGI